MKNKHNTAPCYALEMGIGDPVKLATLYKKYVTSNEPYNWSQMATDWKMNQRLIYNSVFQICFYGILIFREKLESRSKEAHRNVLEWRLKKCSAER